MPQRTGSNEGFSPCGMREFSVSRRSDALYQGTTLVGPLKPSKDEGFSP